MAITNNTWIERLHFIGYCNYINETIRSTQLEIIRSTRLQQMVDSKTND